MKMAFLIEEHRQAGVVDYKSKLLIQMGEDAQQVHFLS